MPEGAPMLETVRMHQANERTMAAWIRTGISLMAFGFAIARFGIFLRQVETLGQVAAAHPAPTIGSAWIGAALVGTGMLTNLTATVRYAQTRRAIERGDVGAPSSVAVYVIGGTATLVGIGMMILLLRAVGD
jgi:putative membrane protein